MKSHFCGRHATALRTTKWRTLVGGRWFWDFALLNSNYHLDHLLFAGAPFDRLPTRQHTFAPFYERHRMRWQIYSGLVYGWLVGNRAPHTNWSEPDPAAVASVGARDR